MGDDALEAPIASRLSKGGKIGIVVAVAAVGLWAALGVGIGFVLSGSEDETPPGATENPPVVASTEPAQEPGSTKPGAEKRPDLGNLEPDDPSERFAPLADLISDDFFLAAMIGTVEGFGRYSTYVWFVGNLDEIGTKEINISPTLAGRIAEDLGVTVELDDISDNSSCLVPQFTVAVSPDGQWGPFVDRRPWQDGSTSVFHAQFRPGPGNFMSISDNGQGVVTGQYFFGDGTRDNSQQWPFSGGSLVYSVFVESIDDVEGAPTIRALRVRAQWDGVSIDDLGEGEEVAGRVTVECGFIHAGDFASAVPLGSP